MHRFIIQYFIVSENNIRKFSVELLNIGTKCYESDNFFGISFNEVMNHTFNRVNPMETEPCCFYLSS